MRKIHLCHYAEHTVMKKRLRICKKLVSSPKIQFTPGSAQQ